MSIRKRGDKWVADITDRARGFRTRKTFKTRKSAAEWETETRRELKRSARPGAGIEAALEQWLSGEAKTLKSYNALISHARAVYPFIKGATFDDIGRVSGNIKKTMIDDGLKPATINRRLSIIRRLGNLAFEWGWIEYPAGKRVKLLPNETERHFYLTMDQVHALAALCPHTGHLIRIAAFTGIRRNELFKLKPEHVSPDYIIAESKTKRGTPRLVPVPDQIKADVAALVLPLDKTENYLLRREFESAREKLKLDHIRFHDLRHSYASFLAQNGASLQLIGKALGHTSQNITARYAHLIDDDLFRITDAFNQKAAEPEPPATRH